MMKKFSILLVFLYSSLFFCSCQVASPEKYFDVAVLNSNRVVGFAGSSLSRELETPSVKSDGKGGAIAKKRMEIIDEAIQFSEEMLSKLGDLGHTKDAEEIISSSLALYKFMLPVYRKEYTELAKMYDRGAPPDSIRAFDKNIKDRYAHDFEELYDDLINKGKLYAATHQIPVHWAD